MYWPLGTPRVYAASRRRRKHAPSGLASGDGDIGDEEGSEAILGLRVSRNGLLIAVISETTLTLWQTNTVVILASVTRSVHSLKQYGTNVAVLLRPDSTVAVVQTSLGFLITYTISLDHASRVYQRLREHNPSRKQSNTERMASEEERRGFPEANIRFRMVIKVDAGIAKVLALDEELIVATAKPPAVQCIRWTPDSAGNQTSTELLSRMMWLQRKSSISGMVHDRAMSLSVWTTHDGRAYAVQRLPQNAKEQESSKRLFRGFGFHTPDREDHIAIYAAINARFSLIAVGCRNADIFVYTARDYVGSIPLSHKLEVPVSPLTSGPITHLTYSPDGYCLFVGFENGWALWSVYGKLQATSFTSDPKISESNAEGWLQGVYDASWLIGGSNILMSRRNDDRLWLMEMAKSAVTGLYSAANVSRTLLYTNSTLMIYRGYDLPVQTTIAADASLWHHVNIPSVYLASQTPIRSVAISADGRYVAVAGKRGLAHYSVGSGRWRTFDDPLAEDAFVVRGGMCWYQHILIAAVETDECHELRLYSREHGLNDASLLFVEQLPSPVVVIALTGQDSLLVYTYENILYHFIIDASGTAVTLVQVGQIALNGIIRAPARVRAVTWILPDYQLRDGDPSHDVTCASVIFLVDAKLVLLQASFQGDEGLKYDMKILASKVEYFDLMRDQQPLPGSPSRSLPASPSAEVALDFTHSDQGLQDSLWYFDGINMHCWLDVDDLVQAASNDKSRELPSTVMISTDFYPTSILLHKGILLGIDADLIQRRDIHFALFRFSIRTQLFLSPILQRHLAQMDSAAASVLAHKYQQLPYFSHALEILLHTVLDEEVDRPPDPDTDLLPSVTSFLSSFPDYLDIIVQCTRKTEVRSWRSLFAHLPPPQELFEASLEKGMLKTAGGYLLVLHTFNELQHSFEQCVRLLREAKKANDWDLCKELARFLMALDDRGNMLREALKRMEMEPAGPVNGTDSNMIRSGTRQRRNGDVGLGIKGMESKTGDGSSDDGSFLSLGPGKVSENGHHEEHGSQAASD